MDGDRLADIGLLDYMGDGNIDTLALDLTGDNEFNLFFSDTDMSGFPDVTYLDENRQPACCSEGYAILRREYDRGKKCTNSL